MAASDDERYLWMYAINWIINEQKKLIERQTEIKKTAQKFKNLPSDKKAELLAKSLKIKNDGEKEEVDKYLSKEIDKYYSE